MVTLPHTAVAFCLFISAVEPQDLTIQTENSRINVTVGGNAFFSVRPSAEVRRGTWDIGVTNIAVWPGPTPDISNEYRTRAELFLPNGSLLLKSVTASDSGDYTVTMIPNTGAAATAIITLRVLDQSNGGNNISSGGIVGIVIAVLLIVGLISGITAWLVKSKAVGMEVQKWWQNGTNINSAVNNISATIDENSAANYENMTGLQTEEAPKPIDEDSIYMELQLQDQSVYGDLMRH